MGLMNGFMAGNKRILKITLSQNMLNSLEVLSQMFINKVLKEVCLMTQSYFKTSLMTPSEGLTGREDDEDFRSQFENDTVEKLTLGMGLMCTIKPLIQCFQTFTKLKTLIINNINMSKLHFMAIDNFMISN